MKTINNTTSAHYVTAGYRRPINRTKAAIGAAITGFVLGVCRPLKYGFGAYRLLLDQALQAHCEAQDMQQKMSTDPYIKAIHEHEQCQCRA